MALLLVVLLAGCSSQLGAESASEVPDDPVCSPRVQWFEAEADGHHVHDPTGSTNGGTNFDFDWSDDVAGLEAVELRIEWNASDPVHAELHVHANLFEGVDYFSQPAAEGTSPLIIHGEFAWPEPAAEPRVYFESAHHEDRPVSASMIILPQDVRVTITEVYSSCTHQG